MMLARSASFCIWKPTVNEICWLGATLPRTETFERLVRGVPGFWRYESFCSSAPVWTAPAGGAASPPVGDPAEDGANPVANAMDDPETIITSTRAIAAPTRA